MHRFKELKVWQEAMELAKVVYATTKLFPAEEKFGLTSQINRAAVSIPSNIAEGSGRSTDKDFAQFLNIALGSAFELETQVLLANSFGFIPAENATTLLEKTDKIQRMLNSFRMTIIKSPKSN
ncbi:four helix bundle protein [Adhaeribacter soli]|uniref:Four helix bundle protein n=1 Tax=Adhaeribacter soli TaxID=2607655 RepID=A0A5N1J239_9BACT|nr:four helix bundle protein [Adhaeribacter soli]KAA9340808.1 four helix bundle protein [Adhaeribacter soli]